LIFSVGLCYETSVIAPQIMCSCSLTQNKQLTAYTMYFTKIKFSK